MADCHDILTPIVEQILEIPVTPVVLLDPKGHIVYFNGACEKLTGYTRAEAEGACFWDFLLLDKEKADVIALFKSTKSGKSPTDYTNSWITKSGETRRIRWSNASLRGPDGAVCYIIGTGVDITEQEKTSRALEDRELFLQSIIDTSPVAIVTINPDGDILSFSPAAEAIFGYKDTEVLSKNVGMLMPETLGKDHDGFIERYLKTCEAKIIGQGRQVTAKRKDGSTFPVHLNIGEFQDGQHIFVAFLEDVSQQVEAEQHNRDLQNKLEQASRLSALGTVASAIAHELNQPLTAASTLMEAAELYAQNSTSSDTKQIRDLLSDATREIHRSGRIIRNMRDFIRKGKSQRELHDLNQVVREAYMAARPEAQRAGLKVELKLARTIGKLSLDRIQIQQVIINLISNAIDSMKSSETAVLTIRTKREHDTVRIDIMDTGTGLPDALKDRIFDPFVTTKAGGLGIGLAICKSIVEAHEGRLTYAPNDPQGAVFSIDLPIVRAEEADAEHA